MLSSEAEFPQHDRWQSEQRTPADSKADVSGYLGASLATTSHRALPGPLIRAGKDVAGGHDELLYGLERAEAAREVGEAWGKEFAGH